MEECERIKAYIYNVEQALKQVDKERLNQYKTIVELAEAYTSDAKYYLDRKDCFTSLACIAYAEGLLDALRHQGALSFEWKPLTQLLKRPRVLVAGSFDILHPGHIHLLREAWRLGEVYVIVSRDKNFKRFKGRKPLLSENERLLMIESVKYVSKAVLGDEEDFLKPIEELKPDIILLGPDQWLTPGELKKLLEERGLSDIKVERLESKLNEWSSSGIIERIKREHC
ncbi:MAG: cytidylyltransferase family protein [Desulfurococcus sp.]|nr:cytidylyltransferase family protein [Desulfurococcus sp.]